MSFTSMMKSSALGDSMVRRAPIIYGQYRNWLNRWNNLHPEKQEATHQELTIRTLRRAMKTPHGNKPGLSDKIQAWPILEKEVLRDQSGTMRSRTLLPVSIAQTGGTTGIPLVLTRSWQSIVFEQALLDHLIAEHCGVEWRTARVAILRGETLKPLSDMTPPFHKLQHGRKALTLSSYHLNANTVPHYLEQLQNFRPEILLAYPSALQNLCGLIEHRDVKFESVKAIVTSSEFLPSSTHLQASQKFNTKVLNYYGQAERVCLAYSINGIDHFFHPAYGHVELHHAYDDEDGSNFDIVGTSFWNAAQPLVRYRTGDFAALPIGTSTREIEEICLGIRPFRGIIGRQSEYLVAPNGEHLIGINHIPRGIADIVQMQLHQKSKHCVEIWVVPQGGFCDATKEQIVESARRRIPSSMAINIVTVDQMFRTARGKAPLVVRSEPLAN